MIPAHGQTIRYVGERQIVIDGNPTPVPFWEPGREFEGLTVVIVGGGPSHGTMNLDLLRGQRLIAVNSSCRRVQPIATVEDMLYFSDNSWSENRPQLAKAWPGYVVTSNRNAKARLGDAVRRIDVSDLAKRLEAFPDYVYASSGHGAACLAVVMGARRLVLIGFEGQIVDGRSHGHSDYAQHDIPAYAERFIPGWTGLAPVFDRCGVQVINATPQSAITVFPTMPLAEALQ